MPITVMTQQRRQVLDRRRSDDLARLVGLGLVDLRFDDPGGDDLVVLLQLSRWLHQAGFDIGDRDDLRCACACLLGLRSRLLAAADLDPGREPVPLVAPDPHVALPSLVAYLHGLLARGARHRAMAPAQLAEQAVRAGDRVGGDGVGGDGAGGG